MSDASIQDDKNKFQTESENNYDDTIILNLENTENDEIPKENNTNTMKQKGLEGDTNLKTEDVNMSIITDLTKPPFSNKVDIPTYRRQFWVQYVGEDTEAISDYTPESRHRFVLFVFTIVFIMFLGTAIFICCVIFIQPVSEFFHDFGFYMFIPAAIIISVLSYVFGCSACTRHPPCNIICLILTFVCISIMAGYASNKFSTEAILYAFIATALVVAVCMALACSKFDFTRYMTYVIVISAAFCAIGIMILLGMAISGHWMKPVHLAILIIGTLLQVVILIIELQLILGGKSVELEEDEYAVGAFMLYTSVVFIFIDMVSMIGLFEN